MEEGRKLSSCSTTATAAEATSRTIRPISKAAVHRICSGQVILDLSSAVKELVENSLDAGATSIEINLKEYGEESFKVVDNGCGISPENFQGLALKYHTSKISDFPDLQSLTSFGFRGEALSSLCALGDLSVETKTKDEPVGSHLTFDRSGVITSTRKTARQVGTTVTVEKLFSPLPVRRKEFTRNVKREFGKLISLIHAYAIIGRGVRLICTNATGKNAKSVVLKTQGTGSLKDNIVTVFGMKMFTCLEPLNLSLTDNCKLEGFVSKPCSGSGRALADRQFFYVNGRPVDMPKVSKLLNEFYKSSSSKHYPVAVINFILPTKEYDVNVTPDKRKIFLSDEGSLMSALKEALGNIYSPINCSYSINAVDLSQDQLDSELSSSRDFLVTSTPEVCDGEIQEIENHVSEDGSDDDMVQELAGKADRKRCLDDVYEEKSRLQDLRGNYTSNKSIFKVFSLKSNKDDKSPLQERTASPHSLGSNSSSCNQRIVQTKLTNFINMNKKHEKTCQMLSELPVLRKSPAICNLVKSSHVEASDLLSTSELKGQLQHGGRDKDEELPEHDKSVNGASEKVKTVEFKGMLIDSGQDQVSAASLMDTVTTEGKTLRQHDLSKDTSANCEENMLDSSNILTESRHLPSKIVVQEKVHDADVKICPSLHFDIAELRIRRSQRLLLFSSRNTEDKSQVSKNLYSTISIEESLPEDENSKALALSAATRKLEKSFKKENFNKMMVIGQFNLGFIIGKLEQDLFIVDQHAADEKYNFERLVQSTVLNQQPLLQPLRLELSPAEEIIVSLNMDIIRKNGFILKEDDTAPPGRRYLVQAVPYSKNTTFGIEDLKELISALADNQSEDSVLSSYKTDTRHSLCPSSVRAMLASRACHSSVTIGDSLNKAEMQKIIHHLAKLKSPWNCPHGRPTMRHLVDLRTLRP